MNASRNETQPGTQRMAHGTLRDDTGSPLPGALVQAFDKQLRSERPLGHTLTRDDGCYEIHYDFEANACKQAPDLLVRASVRQAPPAHGAAGAALPTSPAETGHKAPPTDVPEGDWQIVATSDVLFEAPADATIDLMVGGTYPGLSELEDLGARIAPCLDGVHVDNLTKDDVLYLSGRTGVDASFLQLIVWACRRGKENGLPMEALYGLAREGAPTAIPALLAIPLDTLRSTLSRALDDNLVPLRLRKTLDAIMGLFAKAAAQVALAPPADAGTASVGTVLASAGVAAEIGARLSDLRAAHQGTTADFWAAARADPQVGPHVPEIQLGLQLAVLAGGYAPVVTAIQKARTASGIATARDLVRLSLADWGKIVAASGVPDGVAGASNQERAANYAKSLLTAVEQAFPTPAIAFRIAGDTGFGSADAKRFFDKNPDFEMRSMHVDAYLGDNPQTTTDLASNGAALAAELRFIQRLFRLSPHYDDIRFFSSLRLGAAQDVVRMGRTGFLAQCGQTLGADRAGEIFDRARQIVATAAVLFARYSPRMHGASPQIVPVPTAARG